MTLAAVGVHVALGGRDVLAGVEAAFAPGKITAVVGPNGAGKSTLLACLAGLRRPDRGEVRLDDAKLLALPPRIRAQRIGFLPQIPEIAWSVDARTLVGLGRTPYIGARGLAADDHAAVDRAMAAAGVAPFARRPVDSLSGGERARVLIARALAGEPEWLLADEPLAGLDPGHQLDAAGLFRRMATNGCGVVVTLHDLSLALRLADRVVVLAKGRVVADGPPSEALAAGVLRQAYGIETRMWDGRAGPVIEVVCRAG